MPSNVSHRTYEEIAIDPWGDYRADLRDSGWSVEGFLDYVWGQLTPTYREPQFPVGPGVIPATVQPKSAEIPLLVEVSTETATTPLPTTIDRRDETPHEAIFPPPPRETVGPPSRDIVYELVIGSTTYRGTLEELGNHPDAREMVMGPIQPIVSDEEDDVSILGDIYDIVDTTLGGWLPGGPVSPSFYPGAPLPVFNAPVGPPAPPTFPVPQTPGGMIPPPPGGAMVACVDPNDPYKGMIYTVKKGWHKRPRRRHKQLATDGDIKDLTALLGVFGNGKALQTWIATHS